MTGLQISLLVIGIVFLVGSFFVSEKLSSSDVQEIQKLGEKEIKVLLEKEMKAAESKLEEMAKDKIDEKIESFAVETDKELNNKIMSISEYSDTVLDSMNKSHNEIMFMYEMLNEKQQKVTDLTKELGLMQSAVTQMEASIDDKIEQVEAMSQKAVELEMPENIGVSEDDSSLQDEFEVYNENEHAGEGNRNDEIIKLYNEGLSEIEIAKQMGKGLGEVKLVLGLFNGGKES
ncbi:MAG: hypothetical protein II472_05895 [Lachnospiraceae bacterium]|jgi:uncharacterized protein YneF (UPF0154 family)|nr:hypothetical protein [Lachnospiraceae bacterium]